MSATWSAPKRSFRWLPDAALLWLLRACGAAAASILVLIAVFLARESGSALRNLGFDGVALSRTWHPLEGAFGMAPMLAGSAAAALGAVLLAAPVGILSAVFRVFYAPPWLGRIYLRVTEVLAGIPSVVFGFWGLVVLVPRIAAWHPPGPSLLAAVLVLALMIVPTVALTADVALSGVSPAVLQAAAALGYRRVTTLWRIALPAARAGLVVALLLSLGRALGETMAVLMVAGNVVQLPTGIFQPVRTLTANIALEMPYALGLHRSALFLSGLLLAGLVAGLVLAVHLAGTRAARVD